VLVRIEDCYADNATSISYLDGLSMTFPDWRFNLRCSNTEPLVRLNVETRGDHNLLKTATDELLRQLELFDAETEPA